MPNAHSPIGLISSLAFILLLAVQGVAAAATSTTQDSDSLSAEEEAALTSASSTTGIDKEDLEIIDHATVFLPLTNRTLEDYKVSDSSRETVVTVTLDENDAEADLQSLLDAEAEEHFQLYGRMSEELAQELGSPTTTATASLTFDLLAKESDPEPAETLVEVAIWVPDDLTAGTRPAPSVSTSEDEVQAALTQRQKDVRQSADDALATLVSELEQKGYSYTKSETASALVAWLPPEYVRDDLAIRREQIDRIHKAPSYEPQLEVQIPTVGSDVVQARGITGLGVPVGVIEAGGQVSTSNPYLGCIAVHDTTHSCLSAHTATVVGIVCASGHPTRFGHAPGASVWLGGSCNGKTGQLKSRSSAAVAWGAQALSLSFGLAQKGGKLGSLDRFYDTLVANSWTTVVVAAGNQGNGSGQITSPASAWNVITVGFTDDQNTTSLADDVVHPASSFVDPPSFNGDREKPELVASGTSINSTTNLSPWTGNGGSGSSFAAPAVTGVVAQMMERAPALAAWPESVKSILMATAVHNLEGAVRLSDKDGAGGVDAARADDVAGGVNGNWGGTSYTCASPSPLSLTSWSANAGERHRAVIAWSTPPHYGQYQNQPGADLDLRVIDSSGALVTSSTSLDNPYEIVDFQAPTSTTYTLQVVRTRCNQSPATVGWARHRVP